MIGDEDEDEDAGHDHDDWWLIMQEGFRIQQGITYLCLKPSHVKQLLDLGPLCSRTMETLYNFSSNSSKH